MTQRLDYYAATPSGMKALAAVYGHVLQSGLPRRLIDLVFLRVSQMNGCAFCIDSHSRDLIKAGLAVEHLVLVPTWAEGGDIFTRQERAALAWAEEVTHLPPRGVSDTAYALASSVFNEKELAELTIAIALMNAYNRVAISFRALPEAVKNLA